MELTRMSWKSGFLATWRMRVGLVVESSGWYFSMRLKSPVSATTRLCRLSWSSSDSSTLISLRGEPSTGSDGAYMVGIIMAAIISLHIKLEELLEYCIYPT